MLSSQNLINKICTALCCGTLSDLQTCQVTNALSIINCNPVKSVPTFASLPSATTNIGRMIFVDDEKKYYYSNGNKWLTDFSSEVNYEVGEIYSWGVCQSFGVLGTGGLQIPGSNSSPVLIAGGFTDWCQVNAKYCHSLAIRTDGTLWGWGINACGRLGDGTITTRLSPVSVAGEFTDWCQVSAGFTHSLGVKQDGTAWAWGSNTSGELGDETFVNKSSPVSVAGGFTDWYQVHAGAGSSAGIRYNGTLWAWGARTCGALGDGNDLYADAPVEIIQPDSTYFVDISAGIRHAAGIKNDGSAWAWGQGTSGELGNNCTVNQSSPVSVVGGFTDWCQISAGYNLTLAIRSNGTLWSWGRGLCGSLGDGTVVNKSSPVSVVGGFTDWCQVSAGYCHAVGVRANGSAWAWGFGRLLGTNCTTNRSSPVSVIGGFTDWCQVSSGNIFSLGVRNNGTLWAWGYNSQGRLGDGTSATRLSPVSVVGGFTDWCQVSAGGSHSIAIRANGTIWAWGYNGSGRLGDGTVVSRSSPVSVVGGFTDWCYVSAGPQHGFGFRTNCTAWMWGSGICGTLGQKNTVNRSSPVSVLSEYTNWCKMSSGGQFTIVLGVDCSQWSWGLNCIGQFGNNVSQVASSPVQVIGGFTDWCQATGGCLFNIAVRNNGTLWAWGNNTCGVLGINSIINQCSPVSVIGGFTDWCQVSANTNTSAQTHAFGLRSNGTIWSWGDNAQGRLGNGTTVNQSSPVSVVGGVTDWCQVSAGSNKGLAIRKNGTLWAWGNNYCGALGIGGTISALSPTPVVGGFSDWCLVSSGRIHTHGIRINKKGF